MTGLRIRKVHSPYYDRERPVFSDAPEVPSPFFLSSMLNWHWSVTVRVHTLQYFVAANARYRIDGEVHAISRGSCYLFRPGDRVDGVALDDKPTTVFCSHFDGFPDSFPTDRVLRTSILEMALFESLADHAVGMRQTSDHDEVATRQLEASMESLYYLFRGNLERKPTTAARRKVEQVMDAIRRHADEEWAIDRMCLEAGLSRSQLNRWFNELTGMSPTRFVIHQRVAQAVKLITMGTRPIQEIAAQLGYRDVYFFTRQFTKVMGYPPTRLRK